MKNLDRNDLWGIAIFTCLVIPMSILLYRQNGVSDFRRQLLGNQHRMIRMLESIGAHDTSPSGD